MIKKTVTYTDFNGEERTESAYFHLTEAELIEYETEITGGLSNFTKQVIEAQDQATLVSMFKDLILRTYGVKSVDGKRFIKDPEERKMFEQSQLYSEIFMDLATNAEAAEAFVKGVMPKNLEKRIGKQISQ